MTRDRWIVGIGLVCVSVASVAYVGMRYDYVRENGGDVLEVSRNTAPDSDVYGTTGLAHPRVASMAAATLDYSFRPQRFSYPFDVDADAVGIGDVTGDGREDVVVATAATPTNGSEQANQIFVFVQRPDGGLSTPVTSSYLGTSNRPGLVLGDMNEDAILDIVVSHDTGLTILTATGSGGFTSSSTLYPGLSQPTDELELLDVNLDGHLDVLARTWNYGYSWYPGDGKGGVQSAQKIPFGPTGEWATDDVTGDGLPDLVGLHSFGSTAYFRVYPHDGKSGFGIAREYLLPAGSNAHRTTIADFNGDGRLDVAFLEDKNDRARVLMYYQDAFGELRIGSTPTTYNRPNSTVAADLDRDGRADLVTVHAGWNKLGYYLQSGTGLQAESLVDFSGFSFNHHALGAGDLDGDGCTDVAVADRTNGLTVLYGQNCKLQAPVTAVDDINGDGKSDMVWRNEPKSHWAFWTMDGARISGGNSYAVGPAWNVVATGDFEGDHRLDLIWSDGYTMQMWRGGEGNGYVGAAMQPYPAGYRVVAVGDFDGDGKSDLVWRNDANTTLALWVMDGARVIGSKAYGVSPSWRVAGTGDLNGDRRLDLIWTDGLGMKLWSGASNLLFRSSAMGGYPLGWELAGTGDITGDGRSDLFWRHAVGGYFVTWTMAGPRRTAGASHIVDGSWRVAHVGDSTGDGMVDLVWTNGSVMQLWAATGTGFAGYWMPNYPLGWSMLPH